MVSASVATIEDLGSKNGTYVNGNRIEAVSVLADGDEVVLGTAVLTFRAFPAATSTRTLLRTAPSLS
jgi:pSer/pThr/pTyr-binding forkhead associated (FHA) protein